MAPNSSHMQFEELLALSKHMAVHPEVSLSKSVEEEPLLNGEPYRAFRESRSLEERRQLGAFFTSDKFANVLVEQLSKFKSRPKTIMDPTCGAGDLLLAYAKRLRMKNNLEATLKDWGRVLYGMDVQPDLVSLTKARLILLARTRGAFEEELNCPERIFPNITCGNVLAADVDMSVVDAFLFNPPFGMMDAPSECDWGSGKVNSAAVFLKHVISVSKIDAVISGLLPDVLRSGTRYKEFRSNLRSLGFSADVEPLGRFDAWTDVDVFSTVIHRGLLQSSWLDEEDSNVISTIGDQFFVNVGAVVPHRHRKVGPWHPYICAQTTPRWSVDFKPQMNRRFAGTVFKPPFVAVRRTSSPSDKKRAVGSIVVGEREVAVENHLIVLRPKVGGLKKCLQLLRGLERQEMTDYLNVQIRCRHLTTRVLGTIPWNLIRHS